MLKGKILLEGDPRCHPEQCVLGNTFPRIHFPEQKTDFGLEIRFGQIKTTDEKSPRVDK